MGRVRIGVAAASLAAALAACAPRPEPSPPQPAPQPAPRPQPPAPQPVPPPATNWIDAPLSPGGWTYRAEGAASTALFGPAGSPSFVVSCQPGRQVMIARAGASSGNNLTIRTSNASRTLPASVSGGGIAATLSASDPLLDALAFSRGRFAVEAPGAAQLIVPAWPEPARVVEDCRS